MQLRQSALLGIFWSVIVLGLIVLATSCEQSRIQIFNLQGHQFLVCRLKKTSHLVTQNTLLWLTAHFLNVQLWNPSSSTTVNVPHFFDSLEWFQILPVMCRAELSCSASKGWEGLWGHSLNPEMRQQGRWFEDVVLCKAWCCEMCSLAVLNTLADSGFPKLLSDVAEHNLLAETKQHWISISFCCYTAQMMSYRQHFIRGGSFVLQNQCELQRLALKRNVFKWQKRQEQWRVIKIRHWHNYCDYMVSVLMFFKENTCDLNCRWTGHNHNKHKENNLEYHGNKKKYPDKNKPHWQRGTLVTGWTLSTENITAWKTC